MSGRAGARSRPRQDILYVLGQLALSQNEAANRESPVPQGSAGSRAESGSTGSRPTDRPPGPNSVTASSAHMCEPCVGEVCTKGGEGGMSRRPSWCH